MHARGLTLVVSFFILAITGIFVLFCSPVGWAQELRAIDVVPDDEKRSSIHTVDGYAYLSENMTMGDLRAQAFANAKRQAVEMAETYIRSKTKVADGRLDYDVVWSDAEGAVSILEQKDLGIENNNRYHVWVKAEVRYDLKPKPAGMSPSAVMAPNAPLTVKVWSDRRNYRKGEYITLFVQGNRDFHARIVDVAADGTIIQLLPNDYRALSSFKGGQVYTIPGPGDRFKLRVRAPFGAEKVIVYASEQPISTVSMQEAGAGLRSYGGTLDSLDRAVRAIEPVFSGGGPLNSEFYEATWALETGP